MDLKDITNHDKYYKIVFYLQGYTHNRQTTHYHAETWLLLLHSPLLTCTHTGQAQPEHSYLSYIHQIIAHVALSDHEAR